MKREKHRREEMVERVENRHRIIRENWLLKGTNDWKRSQPEEKWNRFLAVSESFARSFRKLYGGWRKWSEEGAGESSLRFHVKYDRELTDSHGYGPETEPALFLCWSAFFSRDPISSTDHLRNIVRPPSPSLFLFSPLSIFFFLRPYFY